MSWAALTVTDSQGREVPLTRLDGGKYSFTMPGSRVEVQAAFAGIAFSDVPGGAYYEEAVRWAVEKGVTTGTTATTFSPSAPCTRAQLAAFLWRLAGEPESTRDLTFTDVRADAWCAKALRWAAEQGVVTGYADGSFRPDQTVTRIQAVAMLYRYARAQGMDTTQGGMAVREFDDFAAVPAYALGSCRLGRQRGHPPRCRQPPDAQRPLHPRPDRHLPLPGDAGEVRKLPPSEEPQRLLSGSHRSIDKQLPGLLFREAGQLPVWSHFT